MWKWYVLLGEDFTMVCAHWVGCKCILCITGKNFESSGLRWILTWAGELDQVTSEVSLCWCWRDTQARRGHLEPRANSPPSDALYFSRLFDYACMLWRRSLSCSIKLMLAFQPAKWSLWSQLRIHCFHWYYCSKFAHFQQPLILIEMEGLWGFFLWGLIVFFSLCIAKCWSLFKRKRG